MPIRGAAGTVRREALGMQYPNELHTASERAYPARIEDWDYPADHHVRRVIGKGLEQGVPTRLFPQQQQSIRTCGSPPWRENAPASPSWPASEPAICASNVGG